MDAPTSLWIVLDPKSGPEFAAAWREFAHEHIKDCLDEGIHEASRWVVREYTPIAEVERLRADVASLTAQLQSGESFHAVAIRQRDAAWREVEALRASAERWIYINERNGEWRRFEADGPDPAYSMLCVRLPYDADLSCRATREIAIDDARTEQGLTNPK